jgi:hypothetical protein
LNASTPIPSVLSAEAVFHIYGKCDLDKLPTYTDKKGNLRLEKAYYMKNPNNHLELYVGGLTNRFAAFTGNVILNEPIRESTAVVLLTLDKNMRKTEKIKYSEKRDGDRAYFDIVCNLRNRKTEKNLKSYMMMVITPGRLTV